MKKPAPKREFEAPPKEASNDDILTAVRRAEKAILAVSEDVAALHETVDELHSAMPKAQLPPNDGPAPPEPAQAEAPAVTVSAS